MNQLNARVVDIVAEYLGVRSDGEVVTLMRQLPLHRDEVFEIVPRLEAELAITFGDPQLFGMHTYADLAVHADRLVTARDRSEDLARITRQPMVWAHIEPATGCGSKIVVRCGKLTGYLAETIFEDALHAGHGARIHVALRPSASAADLLHVDRVMGRARRQGVSIEVYRHDGPPLPSEAAAGAPGMDARVALDLIPPSATACTALDRERGIAALYRASGRRRLADELLSASRPAQPAPLKLPL